MPEGPAICVEEDARRVLRQTITLIASVVLALTSKLLRTRQAIVKDEEPASLSDL
jgi:hypothetical protein